MNPSPRQIDGRTVLHNWITSRPHADQIPIMREYLSPYYSRLITGGTLPEIILSMSDSEVGDVLTQITSNMVNPNDSPKR